MPVLSCVDARLFEVDGIQKVVFGDGRVSQIDGERRGRSANAEESEKMFAEGRRLVDGQK